MRDEMIKKIEIAKKETLEYYETIRDDLRQDYELKDEEELKRKLFAKMSAFLFSRPHSNLNPFTLYLVIFDFYIDNFDRLKVKEDNFDGISHEIYHGTFRGEIR